LSVLSAATIALALLADATGFGAQTTTLALVLLPVVLLLGIAAHGRLVEINREEVELSLAMNRLRHGYLTIAPALEPYFTTGHHDDEQGLAASYLLAGRGGPRLWRWGQFLVNTPTIVATVDAAVAAAIVVLVVGAAEAATTIAVVAAAVAFLVVWAALFVLLIGRWPWLRGGRATVPVADSRQTGNPFCRLQVRVLPRAPIFTARTPGPSPRSGWAVRAMDRGRWVAPPVVRGGSGRSPTGRPQRRRVVRTHPR
jgi:hypothetical protein